VSAIDLGFLHAMLASDHIRVQTRGDLKIQARIVRGPGNVAARAIRPSSRRLFMSRRCCGHR
jgi:hypothetical protein